MEEIKLEVQIRNEVGGRSIRRVRREDFVPGIVYGGKNKPTAIKVDRRTYERIMRHHQGETVLFHINVMEGEKKLRDYSVIIKDEQHDPVSNSLLHIDFNRISLTEKIEVKVAIVAKGEPPGVKKDGGSLEHILWELEVVCLPTQIPQHLTVDVSHLELNQSIHVKDIALPEGVVTKHDPEGIVVTVIPPMKEEELVTEPTEAGPGEPEVIKEKKKEEGEKAGAAPAKKPEGEPKAEAKKPEGK